MSDTKYVYSFGGGTADGKAEMKNLLGGKGANLAEMASLGIPVPAGFTLTTEVCTYYYDHDQSYPSTIEAEVDAAMAKVEEVMGTKFGDPKDPLLLSVRSGARSSMPGMMETVLNCGLCSATIPGLIENAHVQESEIPEFDSTALAALERWRFTPAARDGRLVKVRSDVTLGYR